MDAKWPMMKSRSLNREMNISRSELCSTFILLIVVRVSRRTDVSIFKWKTSPPPLRIFDYFSITVILFLPLPSSSRDEFRLHDTLYRSILRETSLKGKERNTLFTITLFSVYELLRELGGYLPPKSIAPVDITPLVSRLLRVNGAPLFDFFVDVDLYDRSRSSVFLDLPTKRQEDAFFAENPVSVPLPPLPNISSHIHT